MQSCAWAPGDRTTRQLQTTQMLSGSFVFFLALTCFERLALLESTSYLQVEVEREGRNGSRMGSWSEKRGVNAIKKRWRVSSAATQQKLENRE